MKELHYNVTGQDRKELVGIISKVIGMKAVYKFMPTCAFVISNITVEKDGTMVWDERTDQDTIEAVIIALAAAGFNPVKDEAETEKTGLTIEIPLEKVSVGNLTKLLDAKGELIKKALSIEDIRIELKEDRIAFPWFKELPSPEEIKNVMSKMSEMEATIRELRDIASSINDIANWLTGAFSGTEEAAPSPEPEKALTLEEVRAILAEKSRDGFTAQIRDLLLKYGAKKLSEVDPASYKALVADAEVLGNA